MSACMCLLTAAAEDTELQGRLTGILQCGWSGHLPAGMPAHLCHAPMLVSRPLELLEILDFHV